MRGEAFFCKNALDLNSGSICYLWTRDNYYTLTKSAAISFFTRTLKQIFHLNKSFIGTGTQTHDLLTLIFYQSITWHRDTNPQPSDFLLLSGTWCDPSFLWLARFLNFFNSLHNFFSKQMRLIWHLNERGCNLTYFMKWPDSCFYNTRLGCICKDHEFCL